MLEKTLKELIKNVQTEQWAKGCPDDEDFWKNLVAWVEAHVLPDFIHQLSRQVDEIIDIEPDLSEPEIFAMATRYMVVFFEGQFRFSQDLPTPIPSSSCPFGSYSLRGGIQRDLLFFWKEVWPERCSRKTGLISFPTSLKNSSIMIKT